MNRIKLMVLRGVTFSSMIMTTCFAYANPGPNPNPGDISQGGLTTFWSLTKMGGGISIAIFAVFAIGIFLIVFQLYELMMDKIRGRSLLATNYRQLTVNEVSRLVMDQPTSLVARLYSVLLSIFHTTGNTQDFHDEIANYIQLQQDRFNTFRSRLSFLSDTAGALGLLGTVWGMFVTFFGGNLDSQRILNGMGLALVTTLIGLVVSIILNFCATEVFSVFNKRIELISSRADEFRLWLMAVVKQRHKKSAGSTQGGSSGSGEQSATASRTEKSKRSKAPAFSLKPLTALKEDGVIGQALPEPISVLVQTEDGQRVSDFPVKFEITEGSGRLENQSAQAIVKTDRAGVASVSWTLGSMVGPQKMKVSGVNASGNGIEFSSFARPFIPNLTTFGTDEQAQGTQDKMIS